MRLRGHLVLWPHPRRDLALATSSSWADGGSLRATWCTNGRLFRQALDLLQNCPSTRLGRRASPGCLRRAGARVSARSVPHDARRPSRSSPSRTSTHDWWGFVTLSHTWRSFRDQDLGERALVTACPPMVATLSGLASRARYVPGLELAFAPLLTTIGRLFWLTLLP